MMLSASNPSVGLMVGASVSATVTVPVQLLDAPSLSVAVKVTVVVPSEYGPTGDCASVIASPSGSEEPSSMEASAIQLAAAGTMTFRHFASGAWFPNS